MLKIGRDGMKVYTFNGNEYELLSDDGCFLYDYIKDYVTDYFTDFDYIFGDFSGDKVRLKGFFQSDYKNVKKYNDIKYLDYYRKEYCNYGAKTFLLKKVSKK